MIISRAPFRISFFGGGTDFPDYYREHGGATLLTTIDRFCYLSIHRLAPLFTHRFHASYARSEWVDEPAAFQHPLIRECLVKLPPEAGLEIAHVADLPGRTGLGSSSSFTVALLQALHAYRGERPPPEELAREAVWIERERVGDPGGHQDQYAAAFGGFLRVDFNRGGTVSVRRLELSKERRRALEERLLLFYTGLEQSATDLQHEQTQRIGRNLSALSRLKDMVSEAENIITGEDDLRGVGELLHEAWARKKDLADGISNGTIDEAYAAARAAGALGGKLLGAGGRGFLLVFAEPGQRAAVRARLHDLRTVPVRFSEEGSRIVFRDGNARDDGEQGRLDDGCSDARQAV